MAYVKNVWTDQDVERPRTYQMTENQDGSITLTDDFGLVTDLGTPVNADNMNHIEDGIGDHEDRITLLESVGQIANADLSNLTEAGETHFLNKQQITNCVLEAPNGVYSKNGRNFTVKEGLKVLIPNGRNTDRTLANIEYTVDADFTTDLSSYGTGQTRILFLTSGGTISAVNVTNMLGYYKYDSWLPSTVSSSSTTYYAFAFASNSWYTTTGSTTASWTPVSVTPITTVYFSSATDMTILSTNHAIRLADSDMVDGQWVIKTTDLISSSTNINASTTLTYDLTSYLPKDGCNYEVIFSCNGITGASSSNEAEIAVFSSLIPNTFRVATAVTRTSSTAQWCGSGIILIGADRNIYIRQLASPACKCSFFRCFAYRRIGNNT